MHPVFQARRGQVTARFKRFKCRVRGEDWPWEIWATSTTALASDSGHTYTSSNGVPSAWRNALVIFALSRSSSNLDDLVAVPGHCPYKFTRNYIFGRQLEVRGLLFRVKN
jgi:hypothetical protein